MRRRLSSLLCVCALFSAPSLCEAVQKLYWVDANQNKVFRSNLDGSAIETVLTSADAGGNGIAYITYSAELKKLFYEAGASTPVIYRSDYNGDNPQHIATFDTANFPRALAANDQTDRLYFTSFHGYQAGNGKFRSITYDGLGLQDIVAIPDNYPYGTALDITAGKAYWMETYNQRIVRSNLDGTSRTILKTGVSGQDIQIDVVSGKLYWVDDAARLLRRMNLDGSGMQDIGTIGPSGGNNAVVLDVPNQHVYWSSTGDDKIWRANLDGTSKVTIHSLPFNAYPMSMIIVDVGPVVPEPSSALLSCFGLAGLLVAARRRRDGTSHSRGRCAKV